MTIEETSPELNTKTTSSLTKQRTIKLWIKERKFSVQSYPFILSINQW